MGRVPFITTRSGESAAKQINRGTLRQEPSINTSILLGGGPTLGTLKEVVMFFHWATICKIVAAECKFSVARRPSRAIRAERQKLVW